MFNMQIYSKFRKSQKPRQTRMVCRILMTVGVVMLFS